MGETAERSVTDARGRKIVLRVLDPADMLDMLEAAGTASSNVGWVRYASVISSVASIDDVPVPISSTKLQIRAVARRLGNDGFAAVGTFLFGDDTAAPADGELEGLAKN
jgi:hypothetical protein